MNINQHSRPSAEPVILRLSAEQLYVFSRALQAEGFKPARQIELSTHRQAAGLYRAARALWTHPKRPLNPWQSVLKDRLTRKLRQAGHRLGRKG